MENKVYKHKEISFLPFLIVFAFLIRLGLSIYLYYQGVNKNGLGLFIETDDLLYWEVGKIITNYWKNYNFTLIPSQIGLGNFVNGYYFFNAIMYYLFSDNGILALLLINSIVGTLVVFYTYRVAKEISNNKVAKKAAIIIAVLPHFVFWSSLNFRDVHLALFLLFFVYSLIKNYGSNKISNVSYFLIGSFGMLWFRPWQGIALFLFFVFLLSLRSFRFEIFKSLPKNLLSISIIFVLLIGSQVIIQGFNRYIDIFQGGLDLYWESAALKSSSNSLLSPYFDSGFIVRILLTPLSLIISLIYPFPPWTIGAAISRDVEIISNLFWYPMIPLSITGMLRDISFTKIKKATMASIVTLFLFAFFHIQGPILLQRTAYSIHVFFVIFSMISWVNYPKSRILIFISVYIIIFMSIIYPVIKLNLLLSVIVSLLIMLSVFVMYFFLKKWNSRKG